MLHLSQALVTVESLHVERSAPMIAPSTVLREDHTDLMNSFWVIKKMMKRLRIVRSKP
jgi:hypothetical protein